MKSDNIKADLYISRNSKLFYRIAFSFIVMLLCMIIPLKVSGEETEGVLHAFYPSNAVFSDQIKSYIDNVDSLSFAWSRIDAEDITALNIIKAKNGNYGFYYPSNYIEPVKYAKNNGKSIQLNIYMDGKDATEVLPSADKRSSVIKAITDHLQLDISQGEGIYFDGVVIDFEGLRNTGSDKKSILYEGKTISYYYTQFLTELKTQLTLLDKTMFVAVNPLLYYDGYEYSDLLELADQVILMAHDYEPVQKLQKNQVQQYTGYDVLEPVDSLAPIGSVRDALNDLRRAAADVSQMSKVWLQITFDSAQWQYDVTSAAGWETLKDTVLSKEIRSTPLYKSIKDRVDNKDGAGQNLTYGYNNELQSPYLQYYNSANKTWNVILYEDSTSISAKIDLARTYGVGGISVWSLANVPDYTDTNGLKYKLNGWSTILSKMSIFHKAVANSTKTVTFKDTVIEKAVREKLGFTTEKITVYDIQGIYRLKLPTGVKSIKDLTNLTNLEYLDAQQLGLKDITSLGTLTGLRVLYLQRNSIAEISTLKKLKNLETLSLNGNQVSSITALAGLTKLQKLYLRENKIASLTPSSNIFKFVSLLKDVKLAILFSRKYSFCNLVSPAN
ncbi:MAG: leucine-rich repeat domain-containing protein, partial [Mobilitalea sp.]